MLVSFSGRGWVAVCCRVASESEFDPNACDAGDGDVPVTRWTAIRAGSALAYRRRANGNTEVLRPRKRISPEGIPPRVEVHAGTRSCRVGHGATTPAFSGEISNDSARVRRVDNAGTESCAPARVAPGDGACDAGIPAYGGSMATGRQRFGVNCRGNGCVPAIRRAANPNQPY